MIEQLPPSSTSLETYTIIIRNLVPSKMDFCSAFNNQTDGEFSVTPTSFLLLSSTNIDIILGNLGH